MDPNYPTRRYFLFAGKKIRKNLSGASESNISDAILNQTYLKKRTKLRRLQMADVGSASNRRDPIKSSGDYFHSLSVYCSTVSLIWQMIAFLRVLDRGKSVLTCFPRIINV